MNKAKQNVNKLPRKNLSHYLKELGFSEKDRRWLQGIFNDAFQQFLKDGEAGKLKIANGYTINKQYKEEGVINSIADNMPIDFAPYYYISLRSSQSTKAALNPHRVKIQNAYHVLKMQDAYREEREECQKENKEKTQVLGGINAVIENSIRTQP